MISQRYFISPGAKLLFLYMKDFKDGVKNLVPSVYSSSSPGTAHMHGQFLYLLHFFLGPIVVS